MRYASVAWQKKYDSRLLTSGFASFLSVYSSSMMPQSSIVFPLPGSRLRNPKHLCAVVTSSLKVGTLEDPAVSCLFDTRL